MIYLLDTDTLTHLWNGRIEVVEKLKRLDPASTFGTTIVTKIEVLRGRFDQVLKSKTGPSWNVLRISSFRPRTLSLI